MYGVWLFDTTLLGCCILVFLNYWCLFLGGAFVERIDWVQLASSILEWIIAHRLYCPFISSYTRSSEALSYGSYRIVLPSPTFSHPPPTSLFSVHCRVWALHARGTIRQQLHHSRGVWTNSHVSPSPFHGLHHILWRIESLVNQKSKLRNCFDSLFF